MKMRKTISLLIVAVMLLSLVLTGCGNSASSTPSASAPSSSASAPADSGDKDEVITLKLHHHDPTTATVALAIEAWVERVEARCDGKLDIVIYPAATLGAPTDAFDMVKDGVCDIAWVFTGFFPGAFPVSDGLSLPMMGIANATVGTNAIMDMWNNTDYLAQEYKDVHVLFLHGLSVAPISTNTKIETLEDLKGLTLRIGAGTASNLLAEIGANPTTMASSEIYTSLEKGVLDGYVLDWTGIDAWSLLEQTDYVLDCQYTQSVSGLLMNPDSWNALPDDIKAAFDAECTLEAVQQVSAFWDEATANVMEAAGDKVYTLPEAETAKFQEAAAGIVDDYVASLNEKGYDGQAVYDCYKDTIAKYS